MSMFQTSVLKNIHQDESVVALRWAEYQKYVSKIEFIRTVKEEKYQDGFLKDIFENCLGYTLDSTNPNDFNLEREKKNETDGKKADGVIYVDNKVIGIIELKAQDTKNLDKIEIQAFNYHNSHSNSKYIIISNFDELRFYIDKKTAYERFSLFNLNYDEFKKLHLLLSYESIKENLPQKLKEKSATFEKDISDRLYKDFSLFRTHLFENIVKNNNLDKALLLRLTQKLCDRIIFILFAEDKLLIPENTIKNMRTKFKNDDFGDRTLYDFYKNIFKAINQGNERLNIPKYSGGLFLEDKTLDSLIIDDYILDEEAQVLSDYDFESEVSVNILGHIFEQSLTDLEEINASINEEKFDNKKSKRKKDGVFYTPEYITKYIVDNTLGKLCNHKKEELQLTEIVPPKNFKKPTKKEQLQKDNLEKYRNWLLNLKILDPACGSGAFLNQALEFLINEHKSLQKDLVVMGDITAYYEIEKNILENNLYGVDINEDAVEIAKLSLWLRTATKGRPLTKLANKIKCGNSLIDDKSVVDNAFVWKDEFSEVFENGGFDVVIGNPPYVRQESIKELKPQLKENYTVFVGTADLFVYFYELAQNVLKVDGINGFICSNKFFRAKYGQKLREMILTKTTIKSIVDFNSVKVFEDATVDSAITILEKGHKENNNFQISLNNYDNFFNMAQSDLSKDSFSFVTSNELVIKKKIEKIGLRLEEWNIKINYGIKTGFNEAFIIDGAKKDELIKADIRNKEIIKPLLRGRDIKKYSYEFADKWLINFHNNPPLNIDEYPSIKKHLDNYYIKLEKRTDKGVTPYNLRNCAYLDKFKKTKIIYPDIASKLTFTFDDKGYFFNNTVYFLDTDSKYIFAILNSKTINYYYGFLSSQLGSKALRAFSVYIKQLPIPQITNEEQQPFINLVDIVIDSKEKIAKYNKHFESLNAIDKIEIKEEIEKLDNLVKNSVDEIDSMVYKLYGLSDDEIKIVENK